MKRHPEYFGNALQLVYGDILRATQQGSHVGRFHTQTCCQFFLTHLFFDMACCKSNRVVLFIIIFLLKRLPDFSAQQACKLNL